MKLTKDTADRFLRFCKVNEEDWVLTYDNHYSENIITLELYTGSFIKIKFNDCNEFEICCFTDDTVLEFNFFVNQFSNADLFNWCHDKLQELKLSEEELQNEAFDTIMDEYNC